MKRFLFFLKSRDGATLTEILVAVAMLAIMGTAVMQLSVISSRAMRNVAFSQDYSSLINYLSAIVGNKNNCTVALLGGSAAAHPDLTANAVTPITVYKIDDSGTVDLAANSRYRSLKIKEIGIATEGLGQNHSNPASLRIVVSREFDNNVKGADRVSAGEISFSVDVGTLSGGVYPSIACAPLSFASDKAPVPAEDCAAKEIADGAGSVWTPVTTGTQAKCIRAKCPTGQTQNGYTADGISCN